MTDTAERFRKIRFLRLGLFGLYDIEDDDFCVFLTNNIIYYWENGHLILKRVSDKWIESYAKELSKVKDSVDYEVVDDSLVYEELSEIIHVQSLQKDKTP